MHGGSSCFVQYVKCFSSWQLLSHCVCTVASSGDQSSAKQLLRQSYAELPLPLVRVPVLISNVSFVTSDLVGCLSFRVSLMGTLPHSRAHDDAASTSWSPWNLALSPFACHMKTFVNTCLTMLLTMLLSLPSSCCWSCDTVWLHVFLVVRRIS